MTNVSTGIGERKHLFTGIINANWYNYIETSMEVPQNILKTYLPDNPAVPNLYQGTNIPWYIVPYTKDSASYSRDTYSSTFITVLYSSIFITHSSKE